MTTFTKDDLKAANVSEQINEWIACHGSTRDALNVAISQLEISRDNLIVAREEIARLEWELDIANDNFEWLGKRDR